MEHNISSVLDGSLEGEVVWVCDLRYKDINDKPIRHVKPTKVIVRGNDLTSERVNYSDYHFAVIGKKGNVLKKVIKPFDNTGWRAYKGTPLKVFSSETKCAEEYLRLCDVAREQVEDWFSTVVARKESLIKELDVLSLEYNPI